MKFYLAGLATLAVVTCAAVATPAVAGPLSGLLGGQKHLQGEPPRSPQQRGCERKEDWGVANNTANCKECDFGYHPEPDDETCDGKYQCCGVWCCPGDGSSSPDSSSGGPTFSASLPVSGSSKQ